MKKNNIYLKSVGFFKSADTKVNIEFEQRKGCFEVKTIVNVGDESVEIERKAFTRFQLEKMLKTD